MHRRHLDRRERPTRAEMVRVVRDPRVRRPRSRELALAVERLRVVPVRRPGWRPGQRCGSTASGPHTTQSPGGSSSCRPCSRCSATRPGPPMPSHRASTSAGRGVSAPVTTRPLVGDRLGEDALERVDRTVPRELRRLRERGPAHRREQLGRVVQAGDRGRELVRRARRRRAARSRRRRRSRAARPNRSRSTGHPSRPPPSARGRSLRPCGSGARTRRRPR